MVNSDLFWGLRGASYNFGVIIKSTYKTWPDKGGLYYNANIVFIDNSFKGIISTYRRIIKDSLDLSLFLILGYIYN